MTADDVVKLQKGISFLPEQERHVLSLYYYEEKSFGEISKELNITEREKVTMYYNCIITMCVSIPTTCNDLPNYNIGNDLLGKLMDVAESVEDQHPNIIIKDGNGFTIAAGKLTCE